MALAVTNGHAGLPIAHRLCLPEAWADDDPARRAEAGVPDEAAFRTKPPRIALERIRQALADGVPAGVVPADAGYGIDADSRTGLTARDPLYVVGVRASTGLWPPGTGPPPPEAWSGRGRPPKLVRRTAGHGPIPALDLLAKGLPGAAWRGVA